MKIKRIILLNLLCVLSVLGQNMDQSNFIYYLPFPGTNNTALVDWQFSLELFPQDGKAAHLKFVQLEYGGRPAAIQEKDLLENEGVFNWSFRFQSTNLKTRALRIESSVPLIGEFWGINSNNKDDGSGMILAMRLQDNLTPSLFVPFLPESIYEMTSTISLLGVQPSNLASSLRLNYQESDSAVQSSLDIRSTQIASAGSVIFTPLVTLGLRTIPLWGQIVAETPGYFLNGFQTFSPTGSMTFMTSEGIPVKYPFQPAGISLTEKGQASGWTIFTPGTDYEHELVFTNPTDSVVVISMNLVSQVPKEKQEQYSNFIGEQITIAPRERVRLIVGKDIFVAHKSLQPLRLYFQSSLPGEEGLPVVVGAVHFQRGQKGELSASSFLSAGREVTAWLNLNQKFDAVLNIASAARPNGVLLNEDNPAVVTSVFPDVFGQIEVFDGALKLISKAFVLNGDSLKTDLASASFKELYPNRNRPLLIKVKVNQGPDLIARIDATGMDDIGAVEPSVTTPSDNPGVSNSSATEGLGSDSEIDGQDISP